ncbi:FmdB family zinc ribbon protein [Trinickia sp. YCB016]
MPIYAYRCESCGFEKDVLQKMSDAPLTQCPECSKDTFRKQVTAAGFQLKGSGWYVTDFRGGSNGAGAKAGAAASAATSEESAKADGGTAGASSNDGASAAPASATSEASTTSTAAPAAAASSTSA